MGTQIIIGCLYPLIDMLNYHIIKFINEDVSDFIYFYPLKCLVEDKHGGNGYFPFCNDIATTAINEGFYRIRNGYYSICGSTVQKKFSNMCVIHQVDMKYCG